MGIRMRRHLANGTAKKNIFIGIALLSGITVSLFYMRNVSDRGVQREIQTGVSSMALPRNEIEVMSEDASRLPVVEKIALTFDDGPHPVYTPLLLDGLKERNVPATFFVTGENVTLYPELISRMSKEGHLIGNHTYYHTQLTARNGEAFLEEIEMTNEAIRKVTGEDTEYIRPPYGSWNKKYEERMNMIPVLWDIDPLDWCSSDTACIVKRVLDTISEHCVILMHDQYQSSITAAFEIIDQLQKQGYEFVTVDEILLN